MEYKNLDVFVLTYNRAEYLRIMLDSLCTQTADGFNIKVLNNCSTDNTLEVIEEVKKKYPKRNITVITHEKNLGNVGNFKRSQDLAENEYTAVFADDNAINPEYVETAMNLFNRYDDLVMVSSGAEVLYNIDNNNWSKIDKSYLLYSPQNAPYFQLLVSRPNFPTCIYKTSVYKKAKYQPEKFGKLHDICFLQDIATMGATAVINGFGIRYRIHGGSDSTNYKTGPFDYQVKNVIEYLKGKMQGHFLTMPLLWNFMYFLYKWSKINLYMSWKEFNSSGVLLDNMSIAKDCIFNPLYKKFFSNKLFIDLLNKFIISRANYYRRKFYHVSEE